MGDKIMNGIVITEKNFNMVASRLIKFFDGADIIQWHSFDCGMKRHIPTDFIFINTIDGIKKHRSVYRYPSVSAKIKEYAGRKYVVIRLNNDCGLCYKVGDVVKFCGNRIQTRTKFLGIDFKWCYETYQLWDGNGGFKDVQPECELGIEFDDMI